MPKEDRTRRPRLRRRAVTPSVAIGVVAAAVLGVVAVAVGAWALSGSNASSQAAEAPLTAASSASSAATEPVGMIEIPRLVGLTLEEAETVLSATGMAVQVRSEDPTTSKGIDNVIDQDPQAGVLADPGITVTLFVRTSQPVTTAAKKAQAPAKDDAKDDGPRYVVCIDPGHQAHSNSAPEPIGPGSKTVKPKVTGGATGVKTRIPEYEIALQISMNLKKRLESQGVKVVMTRTTNDVSLSNSERAAISNKAKADLFVRIHGDGSPDSDTSGLSTLYPGRNRWTGSITSDSKRAARFVQTSAIRATGATDRGTKARTDLSGFNWSKRPAVLVEAGFLSNPVEDRLLSSPHYQDKVAKGIADGVMEYLAWAEAR